MGLFSGQSSLSDSFIFYRRFAHVRIYSPDHDWHNRVYPPLIKKKEQIAASVKYNFRIQHSRVSQSKKKCLEITSLASNALLLVWAGNWSACRAKTEKDEHRSHFHSLCTPVPSLFLSRAARFAKKRRQPRRPAGRPPPSCLILAGELKANPVRWLSHSTDKQSENLVMHQRLTMGQVAGTASGAQATVQPIHRRAEHSPADPI